jgi:D-alanine-D-alanine ligase
VRVGLTYDLREEYLAAGHGLEETAELDRPETIAALTAAIHARGHEPIPIGGLRALARRLLAGERWDLVFNIAEGLYGLARESQVPALLDAWRIPYTFSDPMVLALTLHKGMAKRVVRDCGVPTPDFRVVAEPADLAGFDLPFPVFAKPVAEGTSKGIGAASRVESVAALRAVCADLLARFAQPVLVERYLPGREFTVGVLGSGRAARVLGVMEVLLAPAAEADAYSFHNKEHYDEGLVDYRIEAGPLAGRVAATALAAWRGLDCRDGGRVDVRLDEAGVPQFLEVNPLPGLNPQRSDLAILARLTGLDYDGLIGAILDSGLARVRAAEPVAGTALA